MRKKITGVVDDWFSLGVLESLITGLAITVVRLCILPLMGGGEPLLVIDAMRKFEVEGCDKNPGVCPLPAPPEEAPGGNCTL